MAEPWLAAIAFALCGRQSQAGGHARRRPQRILHDAGSLLWVDIPRPAGPSIRPRPASGGFVAPRILAYRIRQSPRSQFQGRDDPHRHIRNDFLSFLSLSKYHVTRSQVANGKFRLVASKGVAASNSSRVSLSAEKLYV